MGVDHGAVAAAAEPSEPPSTPPRPAGRPVRPAPLGLLSLPPELVQRILAFTMPAGEVVDPRRLPRQLLALQLVSRGLRDHAAVAFFAGNAVRVPAPAYWILLQDEGGWLADPARHLRRLVAHGLPAPQRALVRNVFLQPEAWGAWDRVRWARFVRDGRGAAEAAGVAPPPVPELPCMGTLSLETIFLLRMSEDRLAAMRRATGWRISWWPAVLNEDQPGVKTEEELAGYVGVEY